MVADSENRLSGSWTTPSHVWTLKLLLPLPPVNHLGFRVTLPLLKRKSVNLESAIFGGRGVA